MIQMYKMRELEKKELNQLNKISPWWNKDLNKRIRKCKKFITKFGLNPNNYITFDLIQEVDMNALFKSINNYQNFFTPKLKTIVSERHAFKKFDGSIINYMMLNGNAHAIFTIATFYNQIIEKDMSQLDKKSAITFANKILIEKWDKYKKEVLSTLGGNEIFKEVIKKVYSEESLYETSLFDTRVLINTVVKYSSNLLKREEISEKQFLNIMYVSYVESNFIDGFLQIYKTFLVNLK